MEAYLESVEKRVEELLDRAQSIIIAEKTAQGLTVKNLVTKNELGLERLVIIELKRDGNVYSPIRDIMRDLHIHPQGFSKYCMGMALTNESLKRNRFKERLMLLEKMRII